MPSLHLFILLMFFKSCSSLMYSCMVATVVYRILICLQLLFFSQGRRCIFGIALIFVVVEIVSLTRGGLMLVRYKDPGKSCKLVKINGSNITTSQVVHQPIEAEYIFHLIQYAVCLVLRCMEYVLLAHGFYKFTQSYQSIKTVLPDIWSKT